MTIDETIRVLSTEMMCLRRAAASECDRDCAACDLVLTDKMVTMAYVMAVHILRDREEEEKDKPPLTKDEILKMTGQPVWVQDLEVPDRSGWEIVGRRGGGDGVILIRYDCFCAKPYTDYALFHQQGVSWDAYRCPPRGDAT